MLVLVFDSKTTVKSMRKVHLERRANAVNLVPDLLLDARGLVLAQAVLAYPAVTVDVRVILTRTLSL